MDKGRQDGRQFSRWTFLFHWGRRTALLWHELPALNSLSPYKLSDFFYKPCFPEMSCVFCKYKALWLFTSKECPTVDLHPQCKVQLKKNIYKPWGADVLIFNSKSGFKSFITSGAASTSMYSLTPALHFLKQSSSRHTNIWELYTLGKNTFTSQVCFQYHLHPVSKCQSWILNDSEFQLCAMLFQIVYIQNQTVLLWLGLVWWFAPV